MFDFDIAMRACLAKARRIGKRAGAVIVETAQKRRKISMSYGSKRLRNAGGKDAGPHLADRRRTAGCECE